MNHVQIGALVPLTRPGWVEAGRHLLAGLALAVRDVNAAGGRPLELVVRDTAADPQKAASAVDELARLGVAALAGEYHSVVARTAAARAHALGLPFLCSSAVLDALTDQPTDWVARLAPPQSHGWQVFADFLLSAGHSRVAVVVEPSVYWAAGTRILRDHFASRGETVIELDIRALAPATVCDALFDERATALLLLVGHPEPAVSIVKAVRRDPRLTELMIGAPAGQPEFAEWAALLGDDGAAIPFLRYLPERLSPLGARVDTALRERLGAAPSFVAFEGYDTIAVLAAVLRTHGADRARIAAAWPQVEVEGTRGEIRFSRVPGISVWQWAQAPISVVDRDPAQPDRFRLMSFTLRDSHTDMTDTSATNAAITHLIAGVPVSDLDASIEWYTRFFGREPDMRAGTEILWDVAGHATLFIEPNVAQAGAGRITFAVSGLDALLERLAAQDIEHEPIETYSNGVRHVKIPDPDGNAIAFAEAPS